MVKKNLKELYEKASLEIDAQNLFEADKIIEELEKENLEDEKVFILKGKYFEEINKINESFHYFNRSLEINPNSAECLYERGKLFCKVGKKDEGYND